MKKWCLLLGMLFCFTSFFGQEKKVLSLDFIRKAKITLINNSLEVSNMKILSDVVIFYDPISKTRKEILLKEINHISVKKGNYMGTGAFYGGMMMAFSSLLAVDQIETDPNLELRKDSGKIIFEFIAGGVLLGGLIGFFFPRWEAFSIGNHENKVSFKEPYFSVDSNSYKIGLKIEL